ncbi:hypothetical protein SAMN04487934_10685 [Eubacterium ruminantium]|nr:hypothetical protein SAMN04487934_10685 [Eubacterium ruminantium]
MKEIDEQQDNNNIENNIQSRFLSDITWNELTKVTNEYNDVSEEDNFTAEKSQGYRTACCSILDARLEALASEEKTDFKEYKECEFIYGALQQGWLVSDIDMMNKAYELVYNLPDGIERRRGLKLMSDLASTAADTANLRRQYLNIVLEYFKELDEIYELENINDAIDAIKEAYDRDVSEAEYPKKSVNEKLDEKLIDKQSYVMEKLTKGELEEFRQNEAREFNKITKSNRQAIKEVMGEEVYDDIDEMYTGDEKDREVVLNHAQGNKWMKSGADVLELNFLASARTDEWREHKGKDGYINTRNKSETKINAEYGVKAKDAKENDYSYIRYKDKHFKDDSGNTFDKRKYIIGGVTPGFFGALNVGENSIENVKYYGRDFAAKFLKPHFDKWLEGKEFPHDLHISITGWSRGAVAAGQAIKKIDEWINDYKKENPRITDFLDHVKIDALIKDPVPGIVTNFHLSTCNLRNIPNLNATVYCTMANDHYDLLYPFQRVKGAKKIILSTEEHSLDFENPDTSQMTRLDDGRKHQSGFYDAETGEFYRGTGMSQLQNGVFICDDQHNLVRLSSYSQLGKLADKIFEKGGVQRTRRNNIHKMVRDWFVENTLEMGFVDEETRAAEKDKNTNIEERILASPNKRIAPVQKEILKLRELMQGQHTKKDIVKQNNQIIKVCREYMKKTAIPASGDSEYRVNLVSDLLSFTMKENNQLKTEIQRVKNPEYTNKLDAKIRAHKDRLAKKEGAVEKKIYKEQGRLEKEKTIERYIKETVKLCKNYMKDLKERDKNRMTGVTGEEYDAMVAALERGSRLGPKASVMGFIEVLRGISKATDKYVEVHKGLFHGPFSDDGKFRQNVAKFFSDFSKDIGRKTEDLSTTLPDRYMPIAENIKHRQAGINSLNQKIAAQQNMDRRNNNQAAQPADNKVAPARRM